MRKHTLLSPMVWIVSVIVLALWVTCCPAQPSSEELVVKEFFTAPSHTEKELREAKRQMPKLCLEAGDKAIPVVSQSLSKILTDLPSHPTREAGMAGEIGEDCLIRIGGPDVVGLFRKLYDQSKDETAKDVLRAALCWAMASTGSPEDIRFLIESLKGPLGGPKGLAPRAAAYGLVVLRPESARTALEARASEYENVREEVKFALARIKGKPWITPEMDSVKDEDLVVLALLGFGIPHMRESDSFVEPKANRIWIFSNNTWRFEPFEAQGPFAPGNTLEVFVTKDRKRAMVSVSITCGNACGYGYDFMLRKDEAGWRVVGLLPTWIS